MPREATISALGSALGSALALLACAPDRGGSDGGSGSSGGLDGDPWVATAVPGTGASPTAAYPAEGDDGEDALGEVVWEGGGVVTPGSSYDEAWGEAIVVAYGEDDDEVLRCVIGWSDRMVAVVSDCTECEFAFEVEHGEVEVEVDEDGACAEFGLVADAITGRRVRIGYRPGELLEPHDGAWVLVGEAQYDLATGQLSFERAGDPRP